MSEVSGARVERLERSGPNRKQLSIIRLPRSRTDIPEGEGVVDSRHEECLQNERVTAEGGQERRSDIRSDLCGEAIEELAFDVEGQGHRDIHRDVLRENLLDALLALVEEKMIIGLFNLELVGKTR